MADALLVEIDGGEPDLEWMFLSDVDLAGYTNPSRTSWDYPILSPETKERLEEIVKSCNSDVIKKMFYQNVNEAKEKPQKISPKIDIKDREKALEILSSGRIFHREIFRLKNFFYEAEEFGIGNTEEVKEYGERMYEYHIKKFPFDKCYLDGAQDPGSYELKIFIEVARKFLKKPEEEIIELENKRLRKAMRGEEIRNGGIEFEDYLKRVDDASRDLSTERVQAVAQKVYEDLTEDNTKIMHGANYLLAVHLAKTYDFGEDKFKEVADKALEVRKGGKLPDYYYFQQEVELFEWDKEEIRPFVLKYFERELWGDGAETIINAHNLTDKEISPIVQREYDERMKEGYFGKALRIRESYELIQDERVSIEDLTTLIQFLPMHELMMNRPG